MFIAGNIVIRGYSKEAIEAAIERVAPQDVSLKVEALRPTEDGISMHIKYELQDKLKEAGFAKAKDSLVDTFYKEFGRENVAYDLGYPAS